MTVSIKGAGELNSSANQGARSPNAPTKSEQTPRCNPVCLEVNVAIRSLPSEPGGLTQPIREEARTVIVFDNGAVIRSTNNLPIGQTVILSNSSGRDVVCRIAGGRNLPSVKGYVEVEFIEPVTDFWNIHQAGAPATTVSPSAVPLVPQGALGSVPPSVSVTPIAAETAAATAKESGASLGRGPSFDDLAGVMGVPYAPEARSSKPSQERAVAEKKTPSAPESGLGNSDSAQQAPPSNRRPAAAEASGDKYGGALALEPLSISSPVIPAPRDFMSKGATAYEQPRSSSQSTESNGRTPLIIGVAALALASVCGVFFFMRKGSSPAPEPAPAVVSHSPAAEPSAPVSSTASQPVQTSPDASPSAAQNQSQIQSQPAAIEQRQAAASPAAIPAVVTGPAAADSRTSSRLDSQPDNRNARSQEKNEAAASRVESAPLRRPSITNLKIGLPSAPNKMNPGNMSEGSEPMTDIAASGPVGGTPPAGLLTSAGRISKPPMAPASAPAPPPPVPVAAKTVSPPKLFSSTRPAYPLAAKQSNIQGAVTVAVSIDANGKVTGAKALGGPLLLQQAAVESVRQWKYSPSLTDGKPTASEVTVNIDFRLN